MNYPGLRAENNRLYIIEGSCEIGRDAECKICLIDKRVSRRHASLVVKEGFLYIKDERSSNGTYVNGIRITRQTLLQDGDKIRIGDVLLRAEYPKPPVTGAAKTPVEGVTTFEETSVKAAAGRLPISDPAADASVTYEEVDEDGLADTVETLQRRKRTWQKLLVLKPWLLWAAVAAGIFLLFITAIILWNTIQSFLPKPEKTSAHVISEAGVEKEIGLEGGQVQDDQGVVISVPKMAFDQPVSIQLSHVANTEAEIAALPAGLEALGEITMIEWQPAITPQRSLQVDLPITTISRNSLLAAYRSVEGGWQSLGGLIFDKKLRMNLDAPAIVRLAVMNSSGSYGEYRPVFITNNGDAALIVRPWQWWLPPNVMTPGTANLSMMGINVQSHQVQELESSLGEGFYGYASLPYGTYSTWCVSWENAELKQNVYAIINQSVSLTPYSCTWEDYRVGQCEPEKAVFNVQSDDVGNLLSCTEAGKSP